MRGEDDVVLVVAVRDRRRDRERPVAHRRDRDRVDRPTVVVILVDGANHLLDEVVGVSDLAAGRHQFGDRGDDRSPRRPACPKDRPPRSRPPTRVRPSRDPPSRWRRRSGARHRPGRLAHGRGRPMERRSLTARSRYPRLPAPPVAPAWTSRCDSRWTRRGRTSWRRSRRRPSSAPGTSRVSHRYVQRDADDRRALEEPRGRREPHRRPGDHRRVIEVSRSS